MHTYFRRNYATPPMRIMLFLLAGLAMLAGPCGSPTTASAAPPPRVPIARLQVVIKDVEIHDDNEGILYGDGEMVLVAGIWHCKEGHQPPCRQHKVNYIPDFLTFFPDAEERAVLVRAGVLFSAGDGDVEQVHRVLPGLGDTIYGPDTRVEYGFPVYAGLPTVIHFGMHEIDLDDPISQNDYMGYVEHVLDNGENGLGLGTHTVRSIKANGKDQGDYSVTYEVRRAPVPDLRPGTITVHDIAGSGNKQVCMAVVNHEPYPAGPFGLTLRVDGARPSRGNVAAKGVPAGSFIEPCIEVELLTPGEHVLSVNVNETSNVPEYDETNNTASMPYTVVAPKPTAIPSELTADAIQVNGQAPDGKADCKAGKNLVTVTVKNSGKGTTALFTTRLTVDGMDVAEQSAIDLEPGQEHEVRFEGIELKKGEHKLTARVDANGEIAESNEDNNTLTVTATCTGGGN